MPTILVAMDSVAGHGLVRQLREQGLRVLVARSGVDVVSYLFPRGDSYSEAPNLMVLSAILPGYNGLSVLAGVRSFRWNTPVVMTWPTGEPWIHQEARRLGCAALLEEPASLDELTQAVFSALGHQRTQAEGQGSAA
jgi:CheY-like chemotaxis protein